MKRIFVLILFQSNSSCSPSVDLFQMFGSGQPIQVSFQDASLTIIFSGEFQLTVCLHKQKPKFCKSSLNVSYLGFTFSMDEKKESFYKCS